MTLHSVLDIQSADNPKIKLIRKLGGDNQAYRRAGFVWLEGDHLCRAYLLRHKEGVGSGSGSIPVQLFFAAAYEARFLDWWQEFAPLWGARVQCYRLPDALMHALSHLDSPAPVGMLIPWVAGSLDVLDSHNASSTYPYPAQTYPAQAKTVVLDRLQDPGNVGSILRSAAALGFGRVVALKGTAALWSPKVLRAGMGAHFALSLVEGLSPEELLHLDWPLAVTSSHRGQWLHQTRLPENAVWVFGHEGQGVAPELDAASQLQIRIPQPGGEESFNVAAAAAICLYCHAMQAQAA